MKTFRRILLALVVLLVIAGAVVYFYLDRIVKVAVERQSTNSLNLTTTLDSARLAILGGHVNLNDLQIASPQGFSAPKMFQLGQLGVDVEYGQLRSDPVRIKKILIDKPKFVLEQSGGKMNFKAAMDQMPKTDAAPSDPKSQPVKVIIDELTVTDAQVTVNLGDLPGLGNMKPIEVTIPSLTLKNIGNSDDSKNGAAIKDVVMQLATALAGKASSSANLPDQFKNLLQNNLNEVAGKLGAEFNKQVSGITNQVQGQVNQLTGQLEKSVPGVGGQVDKVIPKDVGKDLGKDLDPGKAVGGLLGGDKKDKDKKK